MNILVTVGTTSFESLVKHADNLPSCYNVLIQAFNSGHICKNAKLIDYIDDIDTAYLNADIVVTHAGAGSVYRLLELGKKIIVVPNFERVDKHQEDIAYFVEEQGYSLVLWDVSLLKKVLIECEEFEPSPYVPDAFFKVEEIAEIINSL